MRPQGFGGALRGVPPNLTPFLYWPWVIGKAPSSRHPGPWHCCSAHPAQQTCHPKWCQWLSSSPTLPGSPVGSESCRKGRCSPGTLLDDTPLYPNTNINRWQHPSCFHPWRQADYFHVTPGLLVAMATVLMPEIPWPIGSWWQWGGSWHWTSITLKPMVWWMWRCWGQSSPKFL